MTERSGPFATLAIAFAMACAQGPAPAGPDRYRLAGSGEQWLVSGQDHVFEDLNERYPGFLGQVFDPERQGDLDIRPIQRDLEHAPVDQRNFDALNAIAISYFEINHRAQSDPGGRGYFRDSFRAAKLLALPWKAYGVMDDPELRDAILDFFEDAGTSEKLDAASTAPRLARIVESLGQKEADPARRERIDRLTERLDTALAPR